MTKITIYGLVLLILLLILNVSLGAITIEWVEVLKGNMDYDWQKWLVIHDRLPRSFLAFLCGANLALCGAMMQSIFNNPLAGPTTLGINSGASLGVAVSIFLGSYIPFMHPQISILFFAFVGALLFLFILLYFHKVFKSVTTLLIIGLLLGYVSFSFIEIFIKFAQSKNIQNFAFWGMGSFNNTNWLMVSVLVTVSMVGYVFAFKKANLFNLLLLGKDELQLMGYNIQKNRLYIFLIVGVLVATVTAFAGPLAFVGVAVPNAIKMISKQSNHQFIFKQSIIWGGILCLFADFLTRGVLWDIILPINAILSLLSLPIIFIFLFQNKYHGN
jgi:iron complex transport system permease protein